MRSKINNIVNCEKLVTNIHKRIDKIKDYLLNGKLEKAKNSITYLTGDLFELRVLSRQNNIIAGSAYKTDICRYLNIDSRTINRFDDLEIDFIA